MIIYGTHNSFSFYPPKNFFSRIFKHMAQCQKLNIPEQYSKGVKALDVRIKLKGDKVILCHGMARYETLSRSMFLVLFNHYRFEGIHLRIVLESLLFPPSTKEILEFKSLIKDLINIDCVDLKTPVIGFIKKPVMTEVINHNWTLPIYELFHSPKTFLEVIRGPRRLLHYQAENIKNFQIPKEDCVVFLDFV